MSEAKTSGDPSRHIIVCVDGSEIAHKAYLMARSSFRRTDVCSVLHCAVPGKKVARDLQPDKIKEVYEVELVSQLPSDHYKVVVVNRPEGERTHTTVCKWVNRNAKSPDTLLFVGCAGRKGPKVDPTVLGSVADYSLRSARCSAVVVKPRTVVPDRRHPASIVVAVDGSPGGHAAFELALRLCQQARGDTITVVHVQDDSLDERQIAERYRADTISRRYTEAIEKAGASATFQHLRKGPGVPVPATLIEFANNETDANFIVVGVDGMSADVDSRKSHLGSVSDAVVRGAWAAVVVAHHT